MKQETKNKESLDKIKFYDNTFKILAAFILIFFVSLFLADIESGSGFFFWILMFSSFPLLISIGIINWGMIYHQFKGKRTLWLSFTIISFFFGITPVALMIFYWVKMRKEFKKGGGNYQTNKR